MGNGVLIGGVRQEIINLRRWGLMVSITDSSVIAAIAGTGAGIFMLGFALLIQKTKEELKSSYFVHYFSSIFLLGIGSALYFTAVWLKDSLR